LEPHFTALLKSDFALLFFSSTAASADTRCRERDDLLCAPRSWCVSHLLALKVTHLHN